MHGSDIIFEFNKQDVFIAVSTNKEQIKQLMLNEKEIERKLAEFTTKVDYKLKTLEGNVHKN